MSGLLRSMWDNKGEVFGGLFDMFTEDNVLKSIDKRVSNLEYLGVPKVLPSGVYVCIYEGSLKSKKALSPSDPARLKEKGAKKSLGQARYLLLELVFADAFFRNKDNCTFFRMRSSAMRINNGMLFTNDVSALSV